jgi:hypothetical protein
MGSCFGTVCDRLGVVLVRGPPIVPVVPSSSATSAPGTSSGERRALPVSGLAVGVRGAAVVYGVAAVDGRGRIADRVVTTALGWSPGTRLSIREDRGLILLAADERGVFSLTPQGHVRLPVGVRRWCALGAGDRVLLVADPGPGSLVVFPPLALDDMVRRCHSALLGGEAP